MPRTREAVVAIELETTPGTAETTNTAFTLPAYDASLRPESDVIAYTRPVLRSAGPGHLPATRGLVTGAFACTFDLCHAAAFDVLFQLMGFQVSGTATRSFEQVHPYTANHKTATIALWEGGRRSRLVGANGTGTIAPTGPGGRLQLQLQAMGVFEAPTDAAVPTPPTLAGDGYEFRGATLTLNSANVPKVDTFSLNLNGTVSPREDATAAAGVRSFHTDHNDPATLELPTETLSVADADTLGAFIAANSGALFLQCADPAGNTLVIGSPQAQRAQVADGDRGGTRLDTQTLALHGSNDLSSAPLTIARTDAA